MKKAELLAYFKLCAIPNQFHWVTIFPTQPNYFTGPWWCCAYMLHASPYATTMAKSSARKHTAPSCATTASRRNISLRLRLRCSEAGSVIAQSSVIAHELEGRATNNCKMLKVR
jgi:hypothetical protein